MQATPDPPRTAEAGFTLVLFVVAIALMAIFMGVAVQSISFQMQREKEAELIFRGEQYVEAIRLFKKRHGASPMRLKDLWEHKNPRIMRKKWKDPITDSESWGLVFLGEGERRVVPGQPTPTPTPQGGGDDREEEGEGKEPEKVGPIIGVHSRSCEESIRTYEGRTTYCEWKFILKDGPQPGPGPKPGPGPGPKPKPN